MVNNDTKKSDKKIMLSPFISLNEIVIQITSLFFEDFPTLQQTGRKRQGENRERYTLLPKDWLSKCQWCQQETNRSETSLKTGEVGCVMLA